MHQPKALLHSNNPKYDNKKQQVPKAEYFKCITAIIIVGWNLPE